MQSMSAVHGIGRLWEKTVLCLKEQIPQILVLHTVQINRNAIQPPRIFRRTVTPRVADRRHDGELRTFLANNLPQVIKHDIVPRLITLYDGQNPIRLSIFEMPTSLKTTKRKHLAIKLHRRYFAVVLCKILVLHTIGLLICHWLILCLFLCHVYTP